jgi:hypothetical protein
VTTSEEYLAQVGECAVHTIKVTPVKEGGVAVGAKVVAHVAGNEANC